MKNNIFYKKNIISSQSLFYQLFYLLNEIFISFLIELFMINYKLIFVYFIL